MKRYTHIFFDLDHTLWDFDRNAEQVLRIMHETYALEDRGVVVFLPFWNAFFNHNERLWERFRKGHIKRDDMRWKRFWHTLLDFGIGDVQLAYEMSASYLELLPLQTGLNPFAKELLEHCRGRYELNIITNGFEVSQWQKIQYSGIAEYFGEVITSERSERPKPHREIFDFALLQTGGRAETSLMIGDALEIDVLGAANAGWDQVYYNKAKTRHDRRPTYEVACLSELMGVL